MRGISLTQKRLTAPLRLSLSLAEPSGFNVTITVIRRDLPKQPEDFMRWATVITGALYWCLIYPPPTRRGQFIVDLRRSPKFWLSPKTTKQVGIIKKKTLGNTRPQEAEAITFSFNKPQHEKAVALFHAAIMSLHTKLPAKVTVKLNVKEQKLPPDSIVTVLADFAQRLIIYFAATCQFAKHRPGGATQDQPLTYWVGAAAVVANQIVMGELSDNHTPSHELNAILAEASNVKGVDRIQTLHDRRRFYTAFIVIRALTGTPGLKRLRALAPLARSKLEIDKIQSQIESFHYTYIQPNRAKLESNPALFEPLVNFLRPRLLGVPGALTQELNLPKNAF